MRIAALAMTVGIVATTAMGCSAQAEDAASSDSAFTGSKPHVLAIGDSITFAWDPHIESDPKKVVASNYEGYADRVASRLGTTADNSACPGETSGSFLDAHAEDNGCRENRASYALHTDWEGASTQIDFVVSYLKKQIAAGKPPALVMMTIGGNDLLLVKKHCALPNVIGLLDGPCKLLRLPFAEHSYGEHLDQILTAIDQTGYKGKVVLIKTYALDYSDKIATLAIGRFNGELDEHVDAIRPKLQGVDVRVADAYAAFQEKAAAHGGDTCKTGLLIHDDDGTCDIHPSPAGHDMLADLVLEAAR